MCALKLTINLSRIIFRHFSIAFYTTLTALQNMYSAIPTLTSTAVVMLLFSGVLARLFSKQRPQWAGQLTTNLVLLSFVMSVVSTLHVAMSGPIDVVYFVVDWPIPFTLGIHIDSLAAVMMMLVSFIGLIIDRFSLTYLRDDAGQGRFFRWMSITIGATLLMVISRNLVMFTAAWMLTSFGLHQLLIYYPERTWAIWAARKKFLISRLGDLMLVVALILTYRSFGTFEYVPLFAAANDIHHGDAPLTASAAWIGVFLVLGAITKSAQFPFHSWLPDTLESPTPVSALMQAGVINAGGFLLIRLSPLVTLSPLALNVLAVIGAITAMLGSVVMITQPSIKRSLAYSTIAQMGFMTLQCGLGAYTAALLHIVAHSAYKAHAYLSCGSTLEAAARMKSPTMRPQLPHEAILSLLVSSFISACLVFGLFRSHILQSSGDLVLACVLFLSLWQLIWQGFASEQQSLTLLALGQAILVAIAYGAMYSIFNVVQRNSASYSVVPMSAFNGIALGFVTIGFIALFTLQVILRNGGRSPWTRRLYVHAMNGFYIDIPARRLTALIYRQVAPVQ